MMSMARSVNHRQAATWVAGLALWLGMPAVQAEQKQPVPVKKPAAVKPMTQEEAEALAKQQQDMWNRKSSLLPGAGVEDRRLRRRRPTKTQRQRFESDVPASGETEKKTSKPKIPKAGKSLLPGSHLEHYDPEKEQMNREFQKSQKKQQPTWSKPQGW